MFVAATVCAGCLHALADASSARAHEAHAQSIVGRLCSICGLFGRAASVSCACAAGSGTPAAPADDRACGARKSPHTCAHDHDHEPQHRCARGNANAPTAPHSAPAQPSARWRLAGSRRERGPNRSRSPNLWRAPGYTQVTLTSLQSVCTNAVRARAGDLDHLGLQLYEREPARAQAHSPRARPTVQPYRLGPCCTTQLTCCTSRKTLERAAINYRHSENSV